MKYPPEFIEAMKIAYPNEVELHANLDDGESMAVGCFLLNEARMRITPEKGVELINAARENEVRLEFMRMSIAAKLYNKWELISKLQF